MRDTSNLKTFYTELRTTKMSFARQCKSLSQSANTPEESAVFQQWIREDVAEARRCNRQLVRLKL